MRFASSALNSPTSRKVSTWRSGRTSRCTSAFGLMSLIATKPSALWTWSPSATSLQKRHSEESPTTPPPDPLDRDTRDSLFVDRDGAGTHQPSDGRVDEPGRVVVAI